MAADKSRGRIKRDLPSMTTETYDNEKHGGREDRGSGQSMVLHPSGSDGLGRFKVFRPKYEGPPTYFRMAPALSLTNPTSELRPWRKSDKALGFTPFIVHIPAIAAYFGHPECPKTSFVLYDPRLDPSLRPVSPFRVLVDACMSAHKASVKGESTAGWKHTWNKYMVGGKKGGANISYPKELFMAQGGIYKVGMNSMMEKDGKPRTTPYGLNPDDALAVIEIPSTCGEGLQNLMNIKRKDADAAQPGEYRKMFLHDPLGVYRPKENKIVGGKIAAVFNPRYNKGFHPEKEGMSRCTSWDGKSPEGGENGIWKYQIALLKSVELDGETYTPDLEGDAVDEIFNKSMPWFDMVDAKGKVMQKGLIRIPVPEEQLDIMAVCFSKEPGLLIFGLSDHPEWLAQIKPVLVNAKSFVNPGEATVSTDDDDDDAAEEAPKPKAKKKKTDVTQPEQGKLPGMGDDDDDDGDSEIPVPKAKKGKTPPPPPPADEDDEEEEEEEEDADEEEEEETEDEGEGDGDEEEEEPEEPVAPKKKTGKPAPKVEPEEEEGDDEEEEEEEGDDEEEEEEEGDDEEEEEEEEAPPAPAAKTKKAKPTGDEVFDEVLAKPSAKPATKPVTTASKKGTQTEEAEAVGGKKKEVEMASTLAAAKAAAARAQSRKTTATPPPPPASGGKAKKKK